MCCLSNYLVCSINHGWIISRLFKSNNVNCYLDAAMVIANHSCQWYRCIFHRRIIFKYSQPIMMMLFNVEIRNFRLELPIVIFDKFWCMCGESGVCVCVPERELMHGSLFTLAICVWCGIKLATFLFDESSQADSNINWFIVFSIFVIRCWRWWFLVVAKETGLETFGVV